MKHSLILFYAASAAMLAISVSAAAFSAREHSTVATIAEKYLSVKAKKSINEITGGESIVVLASHPDKFRSVYLHNGNKISHVVPYNAEMKPSEDISKSALGALNLAIKSLENGNYRNCQSDSALIYLAYVVHLVGDMHCPSHIKYNKKSVQPSPQSYLLGKKNIKFHAAWDYGFLAFAYTGGPTDLAHLADIATPAARKQYQQGGIIDWARENAAVCKDFTRDATFDENGVAVIDNVYAQQHAAYAKTQIMKAGYRLAEVLNRIFK